MRGRRAGLVGGGVEAGLSACSRGAALLLYEAILPAVPLCVGRIRRGLDEALAGIDVSAQRRRDIALVVTEAATNTVLHAYGDMRPGPIYVAAAVSGATTTRAWGASIATASAWIGLVRRTRGKGAMDGGVKEAPFSPGANSPYADLSR